MKPHGFPSGRGARVGPDFSLKSQIPGLKIREFMVYVPGGSDKSAIMNKEREIRGRFAPSPTGPLHLGNAMTFLVAWLSVRSRGGRRLRSQARMQVAGGPGFGDPAAAVPAQFRYSGLKIAARQKSGKMSNRREDGGRKSMPVQKGQQSLHFLYAILRKDVKTFSASVV